MKHKKDSKKSKHKKHKSKDKSGKKHKKSRTQSTSSSNNSSDDNGPLEWVEKETNSTQNKRNKEEPATLITPTVEREEWMGLNSLFPCVFNPSYESKKLQKKEQDQNKCVLDEPGQSERELNPYWKNGGNGLPQTNSEKSSIQLTMDANWLKKSLQRAQEQANEEGRSLEDIAAERWGSLEAIQDMITKAEHAKYQKCWNSNDSKRKFHSNTLGSSECHYSKHESSLFQLEGHHKNSSKIKKLLQQQYKKPVENESDECSSFKISRTSNKNWKKKSVSSENNHEHMSPKKTPEDITSTFTSTNTIKDAESVEEQPMTEAELNKLGAKIVKAEIMGNIELANQLKAQMETARKQLKSAPKPNLPDTENIILVRTDSKGVSRPLEQKSYDKDQKTFKKRKIETHVSGERVQHFFDDDKYSLQQLFHREKGRSTVDDDAAFSKAISKNIDMADLFEEQIANTQSGSKQESRDRANAINEHKRLTKSLDSCRWCVDSKYMLKHMIVKMDSKICLSLPTCTSLTEGHCVLTPVHHISCQLQLDEDIWDQLKVFKQTLCNMFAARDQCTIFFEVYKNRRKFPHMRLECIPLPKEIGDSAPLYFKKALLECESEWSINQKVIDLKDKDLRRCIPNGLCYFMVQFGTQGGGYAHVIEDEHMFPRNFAEEIIGGMIDAEPDLWRKPRLENFDQQREKVLRFRDMWSVYDLQI